MKRDARAFGVRCAQGRINAFVTESESGGGYYAQDARASWRADARSARVAPQPRDVAHPVNGGIATRAIARWLRARVAPVIATSTQATTAPADAALNPGV